MLAVRQLVPSSVTHIACPLLLEDGSTVLLTAMASSLYVRLPVWELDDDGKMRCVFVSTEDELHIGTVAVDIVACAHQCFIVITQDCELLVGRYQANLPAPPNSWLVNDPLHHNNAWIILHRGKLSGGCVTSHFVRTTRMLFASDLSGTLVHCCVLRGWRHTVGINIPENMPKTFFNEKWCFDIPQSVGPYFYSVTPFRRDVIEQSDEELLTQCTVAQLAQRKRSQQSPVTRLLTGSPPVDVTLQFQALDGDILSIAVTPAASQNNIDRRFVFVFSHSTLLSIYDGHCFFLGGNVPINLGASGSPYFVLSTKECLFSLSLVDGIHVLSALGVNPVSQTFSFNMLNNLKTMRIARSSQKPVTGVVVQNEGVDGGEVLWLLLDNGSLTEVYIEALKSSDEGSLTLDAPNIQSGDCEDGDWFPANIIGLPCGFCAVSLVPFWRYSAAAFQPYAVTERYVLLGDGVSDVYLIDLVERRVVGSLPSHGAMTSACDGPDMDIIIAHSKGMLQRISPGVRLYARLYAEFAGLHQVYPLPHMNSTHLTETSFHFLASTATHTILFRGTMGKLQRLQGEEAGEFVLGEPTCAVYSASCSTTINDLEEPASSFRFWHFAQCTNTCVNFDGLRISFASILPGLDAVSYACFAGDKFIAVANCQTVVIFLINSKSKHETRLNVHLQERLSGDVSHLTAWKVHGLCQWGIAACLWSHKIVVWFVNSVGQTRRYELPIGNDVVASSFLLSDNSVGLTFLNRTVAVFRGAAVDSVPTVTEMVDVNGKALQAECCLPIGAYGSAAVACNNHFNLAVLCDGKVDLMALGTFGDVEDEVRVLLSTPSYFSEGFNRNSSVAVGYEHIDLFRTTTLRCGFVFFITDVSFYVFVLYDGSGISIWSLPELLSPLETNADSCRRRGFLLRGPVEYQVTHAVQLPFITAYDQRLTRVAYLPSSKTIVTLTDRGGWTSLVSTIDVDSFLMIDSLPMATGEVPTCIESFLVSGADVVVIGTAHQSMADSECDPTSGRLLVVHVRPLRISATAYIATGGVLDVSVQSHWVDNHLIAVACMGHVLVYRLAGLSLSLLCSTETKSACTTVTVRFPFISCGLYLLGTQYFQLLPEGRATGSARDRDVNDAEDCRSKYVKESCGKGESTSLLRWRETTFALKACAVEPTAFININSQCVYGDDFARIDADRNLVTVTFSPAPEQAVDGMLGARVIGVEGGYSSALTRCFRLQSLPLQVRRSGHARVPWRHRSIPFVSWCNRPTALRLVGDTLLLPCADGSLHCAGEIPHAFASPLLRLEQGITELYDTTVSLSLMNSGSVSSRSSSFGGGVVRRTYHSVSFATENSLRNATRVLQKQSFLCVDAIEEFFFITRLAELPNPYLTPEERALVAGKKRLFDEHLVSFWSEYSGELRDIDLGEMLHLW